MDEFRKKFIYLCNIPGISWNEIYQTLKKDPQLQNLSKIKPHHQSQSGIVKNQKFQLSSLQKHDYLHEQIKSYSSKGIEVITYFDDHYPPMLKEIYQPPWCLFLLGNSALLHNPNKLAIVGARQASPYGCNVIEFILPPLVKKNIIIISGLAKGIDALAHQTTMDYGGNTIAVIAGGFFHLYPKENENLAKRIAIQNLIISEYPPDTKPLKWHFPARNRIISGLSLGTIIIEAKRKSGSLITANYALQEGREVFAIPGNIFSELSEGTNDLIQQGAKLVLTGEDILSELRV
jgi:DNA processing protein